MIKDDKKVTRKPSIQELLLRIDNREYSKEELRKKLNGKTILEVLMEDIKYSKNNTIKMPRVF